MNKPTCKTCKKYWLFPQKLELKNSITVGVIGRFHCLKDTYVCPACKIERSIEHDICVRPLFQWNFGDFK